MGEDRAFHRLSGVRRPPVSTVKVQVQGVLHLLNYFVFHSLSENRSSLVLNVVVKLTPSVATRSETHLCLNPSITL